MNSKPGVTQVTVMRGFDGVSVVPKLARSAKLEHRVAIIQHTYRPDSADMYFDAPLWERLLKFAENVCRKMGGNGDVRVVSREGADACAAAAFLARFRGESDAEREPPELIIVREQAAVVLLIVTEYWAHAGGPAPYADSYTYAIFSRQDIGAEVTRFLREARAAGGWDISA